MASSMVAADVVGGTFEDHTCAECGTRLGVETVAAIVHHSPEFGIVGWLHDTVCRSVWFSRHYDDRGSFRLVEVA